MARSSDTNGWLALDGRYVNLRNVREIRKRHHMKEFFLSIVMESGVLIDVPCGKEPDLDTLLRPTPLPLRKKIIAKTNSYDEK